MKLCTAVQEGCGYKDTMRAHRYFAPLAKYFIVCITYQPALVECLKSGGHSITLRNMLSATDTCGRTACNMAATNHNVQALRVIRQWAEGVTPTLSYSLLVSQDKQSKTTWHFAA